MGEATGVFGGNRSILKLRPGQVWESRLRVNVDLTPNENSAISQGDPTFFIQIFGPKIAAAWGFESPSPETVTLPDARELQGAVDYINKQIKDKSQIIRLGFYEVPGEVSTKDYVSNFIKYRKIPISRHGILSVHDRSIHPIHAFIPSRFDDFAISRMTATNNFINYVKSKRPDIYKNIPYWVKAIRDGDAAGIDIVSAAMTGLYIELSKSTEAQNARFIENQISRIWKAYLSEGRSTKKVLHKLMESMQAEIRMDLDDYDNLFNPDITAVKKLFQEFQSVEMTTNALYAKRLGIKKEDILPLLQLRINFILSVIK